MKCPKCGQEDWEVTGTAHDAVVYGVKLHDDLSFDTEESRKEYCGETDWEEYVELWIPTRSEYGR